MVIFLQVCIKLPQGTRMTSETKPFVQLVGDDAHQKEVETKCYASEITQLYNINKKNGVCIRVIRIN